MPNAGKSYLDPVKQRVREEEYGFFQNTIMQQLKPDDIHVVCLPGAEQDGQVALELPIYDRMKIPRRNIWGVEMMDDNYARLEAAGLGIHTFHGTMAQFLDYARQVRLRFEIFSGDYVSPFDPYRAKEIETLVAYGLLGPKAVIATNFYARENRQTQEVMANSHKLINMELTLEKLLNLSAGEVQEMFDEQTFNLQADRGVAIRNSINAILAGGSGTNPEWRRRIYRRFRHLEQEFMQAYARVPEFREMIDGIEGDDFNSKILKLNNFQDLAAAVLTRDMAKGSMDVNDAKMAAHMLLVWLFNPYIQIQGRSLVYTSNSRSRFYTDLFYVEQMPKGVIRAIDERISYDLNEGRIIWKPTQLVKRFNFSGGRPAEPGKDLTEQYQWYLQKLGDAKRPMERIEVGAELREGKKKKRSVESQPTRTKGDPEEKGDQSASALECHSQARTNRKGVSEDVKAEIYDLLDVGFEPAEIAEEYNLSVRTVLAYKAWRTMRMKASG